MISELLKNIVALNMSNKDYLINYNYRQNMKLADVIHIFIKKDKENY